MKNGYPMYISWQNPASNPISLSYKINRRDATFSSSHSPPSSMAPGENLCYKFTTSALLDPTKRSLLSFAEGFNESASTGGGGSSLEEYLEADIFNVYYQGDAIIQPSNYFELYDVYGSGMWPNPNKFPHPRISKGSSPAS